MATNSNRGFAAMDPDKQREIASKGGKASGGNKSSGTKARGADGQTGAAKRGGTNSRRNG